MVGIEEVLHPGVNLCLVVVANWQGVLHLESAFEEDGRLEGARTEHSHVVLSLTAHHAVVAHRGRGAAFIFGQARGLRQVVLAVGILGVVSRDFVAGQHRTREVTGERHVKVLHRGEGRNEITVHIGRAIDAARGVGVVLVPLLCIVPLTAVVRGTGLQRPILRQREAAFEARTHHLRTRRVGAGFHDHAVAVRLREVEGIVQFGVERLGREVQLPAGAQAGVPVGRKTEAVRPLFVEVLCILDQDQITTGVVHVQVLVEDLRSAETGAIVGTQHQVGGGIETHVGARAHDGMVQQRMLVHAAADQEAPPLRLPLVLQVTRCGVHVLFEVVFAETALVLQIVVIVFHAHGELRGHEEQAGKVIGILRAEHTGVALRAAVAHHTLVHFGRLFGCERSGFGLFEKFRHGGFTASVVTFALHLHERGEGIDAVARVGRDEAVVQTSRQVVVAKLFGRVCIVRLVVKTVAAAAEFTRVVQFGRQT